MIYVIMTTWEATSRNYLPIGSAVNYIGRDKEQAIGQFEHICFLEQGDDPYVTVDTYESDEDSALMRLYRQQIIECPETHYRAIVTLQELDCNIG